MKVKTNELSGAQLDWAVAKCEGVAVAYDRMNGWWETSDPRYAEPNDPEVFSPSTNWAQGGPIIEREEISTSREFASSRVEWAAWTPAPIRDDAEAFGYGPTPLIAAMRCYVASKLGDEAEVPKEEGDK
jgi:hypothetical protein